MVSRFGCGKGTVWFMRVIPWAVDTNGTFASGISLCVVLVSFPDSGETSAREIMGSAELVM